MKDIDIDMLKRVNIRNLDTAIKTFALLRSKGYNVDIAISSDRLVFLDVDVGDSTNWYKDIEKKRKFIVLVEIVKEICKEYNIRGLCAKIYRTPHGFHAIIFHKFTKQSWRRIYLELYEFAIRHDILDVLHIKATLQRGYTTLRLNQIECLAKIEDNMVKSC